MIQHNSALTVLDHNQKPGLPAGTVKFSCFFSSACVYTAGLHLLSSCGCALSVRALTREVLSALGQREPLAVSKLAHRSHGVHSTNGLAQHSHDSQKPLHESRSNFMGSYAPYLQTVFFKF